MWQLQDSHRLVVTVPKLQLERQEWWPRLLVGDPEINTDRCRARASPKPRHPQRGKEEAANKGVMQRL
jgi:hypothetical protein